MKSVILVSEYYEKHIAITLFAVLIAGFLFYGYLVNQAVLEVVERRDIESEMTSLSSRIGELESSYMALKGSIDMDFAREIGFREPASAVYVSRAPLEKSLTLNDVR